MQYVQIISEQCLTHQMLTESEATGLGQRGINLHRTALRGQ